MSLRILLIVAVGLAAAFVVHDLLVTQRVNIRQPVASPAASEPPPSLAQQQRENAVQPPPSPTARELPQADVPPAGPPPLAVTFGPPGWDEQVKAAVVREQDATAKSKALLAMLPRMPEEALAEVAEKAVNDLPDRAYATTALPIVTNPDTPGQVLSVLFADLMERPDAITLPALLQIAHESKHPYSPSALDNLRLLLRVDRGNDWAAWEKDVQRKIAEGR